MTLELSIAPAEKPTTEVRSTAWMCGDALAVENPTKCGESSNCDDSEQQPERQQRMTMTSTPATPPTLYDIVAVDMATSKLRVIDRSKTLPNAQAIVTMCVARRGCDKEFFAAGSVGKYHDGDTYKP